MTGAGPSPLTRGKQAHPLWLRAQAGSIPAHAGETLPVWRSECLTRVHPRSRGGNHAFRVQPCGVWGPSPLTRGKPTSPTWKTLRLGSIPAHAGETAPLSRSRFPWTVHPRSRGGNSKRASCSLSCLGPSPLTRGKLRPTTVTCWLFGSIPAHAGETDWCISPWWVVTVHPRSRGETRTWPVPS